MVETLALAKGQREFLSALDVKQWFIDAGAAPLSSATYQRLAREMRIIANRHRNREALAGNPKMTVETLHDVSPAAVAQERLAAVLDAADVLLTRLQELAEVDPRHDWLSLEEMLLTIGANPRQVVSNQVKTKRGRPHSPWHAERRSIARLIESALREAGHKKRLRHADGESLVADIGAKAITWLNGEEIQPSGFATDMQGRKRSKDARRGQAFAPVAEGLLQRFTPRS